jgi:hypothetical protein
LGKTTKQRIMQRTFEILVDKVPYRVSATPFDFNAETRYRVEVNGAVEHIFTWDSSIGRLAAIDDDAGTLPDDVEQEIARRLQSRAS